MAGVRAEERLRRGSPSRLPTPVWSTSPLPDPTLETPVSPKSPYHVSMDELKHSTTLPVPRAAGVEARAEAEDHTQVMSTALGDSSGANSNLPGLLHRVRSHHGDEPVHRQSSLDGMKRPHNLPKPRSMIVKVGPAPSNNTSAETGPGPSTPPAPSASADPDSPNVTTRRKRPVGGMQPGGMKPGGARAGNSRKNSPIQKSSAARARTAKTGSPIVNASITVKQGKPISNQRKPENSGRERKRSSLTGEDGGAALKDAVKDADPAMMDGIDHMRGPSPEHGDYVRVAVRVRPFNERELASASNDKPCVFLPTAKSIKLITPPNQAAGHNTAYQFTYDHSFWSVDPKHSVHADQQAVFEAVGAPVVESALAGFNACVLAYGQTGTGKTYTMLGPEIDGEEAGLIPRICQSLFARVEADSGGIGADSKIDVSYYEIYGEQVFDLLAPGMRNHKGDIYRKPLKVREHQVLGPHVEGITSLATKNYAQIVDILQKGGHNRHIAATRMNAESSRSHAVLTLGCTFKGQSGVTLSSKVALVDLAGSERVRDTGVSGTRLTEGAGINKALSALGTVIQRLSGREMQKKAAVTHIPYRDSTLTWVLKEFLGGNARTTMIATVSPDSGAYEETYSTLSYINRARKIRNKAKVNENAKETLIRDLREHIAELEAWLAEKSANPVFRDEVASQIATSTAVISKETTDWEKKVEETEARLAEMNDWRVMAEQQQEELKHALGHERWRLATMAVSNEVKIQHQHERANQSKAALADRILELEAELAAEKAKNSSTQVDGDVVDKYEGAVETTRSELTNLNGLTVYLQDQFAQAETVDGCGSTDQREILESLHQVEAAVLRLKSLLDSPSVKGLLNDEGKSHLRRLPVSRSVELEETVHLRHIEFEEAESKATWAYYRGQPSNKPLPHGRRSTFVTKRIVTDI